MGVVLLTSGRFAYPLLAAGLASLALGCAGSQLNRARDAEQRGQWGEALTAYAFAHGEDLMVRADFDKKVIQAERALGPEALCRDLQGALDKVQTAQTKRTASDGYSDPALNRSLLALREARKPRCKEAALNP